MATIVTRAGKGSPLTHDEVDDNFSNLNTDKVETSAIGTAAAADTGDFATAAQGTTADAALPRTGGAMTGAITTNSTFDGRDVATDGTKLDGIEANADVTDTANVTAAGALMDSELTDIASVKALDQGVATTDSPAFSGLTVDTDTLYVDAANNRVGVGTTSPSQELTVATKVHIGSGAVGAGNGDELVISKDLSNMGMSILAADDTGNCRIFFGSQTNNNAAKIQHTESSGRLTVQAEGDLYFQTGGTNNRVNINSSTGNVGIGLDATAASTALEVSGTVTATAFAGDGSALTNLPVSVAVYVDAAGGASADSTSDTVVPATTAEIEDTSNYSNTSGVVTVTDAGTYCVKGNVGITSTTSNYRWTGELSIVKNGSTVVGKVRGAYLRGNGGSNDSYIHIDKMLSLAASDTIQLKVKRINNTSGNATFLADVSTLQLQKL